MNRLTSTLAVTIGALLLPGAQPALACGSTDYNCHAAYTCFVNDYQSYTAPYGRCPKPSTGGACLALHTLQGQHYSQKWISCDSMNSRGDDDLMGNIFRAGQEVRDRDGAPIEIDRAAGELIQVATSINALQRRGAAIGTDVSAAFVQAGIPLVESVDVQVAENAETGEQTFTLRGRSDEEVVMRFDAEGKAISDQREPPPELMEEIEALEEARKKSSE